MTYLKSVVTGAIAAVAAFVVYHLAALTLVFVFRLPLPGVQFSGSGGLWAISADLGLSLLVALIAFVAGFFWQFRRASKRTARHV